jgi:hypothetical protein
MPKTKKPSPLSVLKTQVRAAESRIESERLRVNRIYDGLKLSIDRSVRYPLLPRLLALEDRLTGFKGLNTEMLSQYNEKLQARVEALENARNRAIDAEVTREINARKGIAAKLPTVDEIIRKREAAENLRRIVKNNFYPGKLMDQLLEAIELLSK